MPLLWAARLLRDLTLPAPEGTPRGQAEAAAAGLLRAPSGIRLAGLSPRVLCLLSMPLHNSWPEVLLHRMDRTFQTRVHTATEMRHRQHAVSTLQRQPDDTRSVFPTMHHIAANPPNTPSYSYTSVIEKTPRTPSDLMTSQVRRCFTGPDSEHQTLPAFTGACFLSIDPEDTNNNVCLFISPCASQSPSTLQLDAPEVQASWAISQSFC